jgi:glycosyltransferase involved in cell wall biosynthesis
MKKVLILAYDFAPYNSIGAQRPLSWFKYFHEHEIVPIVVTREWTENIYSYTDSIKPLGGKRIEIETSDRGTIIRVPFIPSLRDKLLIKQGARFVIVRRILSLFYLLAEFIYPRIGSKAGIYSAAKKYLAENTVDLIIATAEPYVLFKYASLLSKKYKIPWIADYRDCWSNNPNISKPERIWYSLIEPRVVKTAHLLVTVSKQYIPKIAEASHRQRIDIKIIYNGYWSKLFNTINKKKSDCAAFRIVYSGTVYPYQKLEMFIEGFKQFINKTQAKDCEVIFLGLEFFPNQVQRLGSLISGYERYFKTTPRLPLEKAAQQISNASILLLLASATQFQLYAKLFDYIASQKPVLMVENDKSEIAEILMSLEMKWFCSDSNEVANNIEQLYLQWKDGDSLEIKSDVQKYSRNYQAKKYAELIRNLLE